MGRHRYTGTTAITAWQTATGQEKIGGSSVFVNKEPQLVVYGGGGTVGGYIPASLPQYQLQINSPMLTSGIDVASQYGISYPSKDFYGVAISSSSKVVGAGQTISWTNGTGTCSQATTFLARTSSPPTATQEQYNALICGMVADGNLSGLDALYKMATDSATDANLNLIGTSFPLTPTGSPTFAANSGYTGGATAYLANGYIPSRWEPHA